MALRVARIWQQPSWVPLGMSLPEASAAGFPASLGEPAGGLGGSDPPCTGGKSQPTELWLISELEQDRETGAGSEQGFHTPVTLSQRPEHSARCTGSAGPLRLRPPAGDPVW